jgi:hypothetical protein
VEPPVASTALISELEWASEGVKANFGQYDASLGAVSNETSGRAILARTKQSDTATFNFPDNLNMALMRVGRIVFDMIPAYYDTERTVKILNEDNTEDMITINKIVDPQTNVNIGKYSVKVVTGPNYNTKRQETADAMLTMINAAPDQLPIMADVLMQNMDWEGADILAKRFKKLLPPQLAEDENGEPVQQQPDPLQEAETQMQIQMAELEKAIKEQELEKAELENEKIGWEIKKIQAEIEQEGKEDAVQSPRKKPAAQKGK